LDKEGALQCDWVGNSIGSSSETALELAVNGTSYSYFLLVMGSTRHSNMVVMLLVT